MGLSAILGQGRAVRILSAILKSGHLASTYLFAGLSGTGKMFTAVQFVKALNCQEYSRLNDSCDSCISCRKIDSTLHPDIRVLRPFEGMIRIEEVRAINEYLSLMPSEGKRKAVIVEDADRMNEAAGNAFLKTLEEPPQNSLIILLSSSEYGLLDTIRSRSLRILFNPLSYDAMRSILSLKGIGADDAAIRLACGSVGGFFEERKGRGIESGLDNVEAILAGREIEGIKERDEFEGWLIGILPVLRDIVLMQTGVSDELFIYRGSLKRFTTLRPGVMIKDVIRCFDAVSRCIAELDLNINRGMLRNYITGLLRETLAN